MNLVYLIFYSNFLTISLMLYNSRIFLKLTFDICSKNHFENSSNFRTLLKIFSNFFLIFKNS